MHVQYFITQYTNSPNFFHQNILLISLNIIVAKQYVTDNKERNYGKIQNDYT